jgi:hypothetical protein
MVCENMPPILENLRAMLNDMHKAKRGLRTLNVVQLIFIAPLLARGIMQAQLPVVPC